MTSFFERSYEAPFFFRLPTPLFDMGMLWRAAGQYQCGESTQLSWSWCGWTGPAIYMAAESVNNMCECTVSQADIYATPGGTQLCSNMLEERALGSAANNHQFWRRSFDTERLRMPYRQIGTGNEDVEYPRPLPAVSGYLVPRLKDKYYMFPGLSRSTLYRVDEDPSCDGDSHTFPHWTRQSVADLDQCYVDEEPNHDSFDRKNFDARVGWSVINVLLVSESDKNGVVERLGVGKIHVIAFEAVCGEDEILLG